MSSLPRHKGIGVCLTFGKGKAKEVGLELGKDLAGEDGARSFVEKAGYTVFEEHKRKQLFDRIKRKANKRMADFIVDFYSLYTKIRKRKIVLPKWFVL